MFNRETNHCYVAGEIEEEQVLKTIAHEYKHYIQKCEGVDFNEEKAEDFADYVYNKFRCEIRQTVEECEDCRFCEVNNENIRRDSK